MPYMRQYVGCVFVCVVDCYLHNSGFRMWNRVLPGLEVSTFVSVKDCDSWPKLCCSQSFVPRDLFRIITETRTASNCLSFVVMFPGMVCRIFVRFFFIIPVAPIIISTIPELFNFQDILILGVLIFGHFLDFSIISTKITGY